MSACKSVATVVLMVLAAVAMSASAGTIRDDRDPQLYLDLGALPEYASVGRFDFTTSSANYLASGTLIASDWVLTAAHVVDDATSLDFSIGGESYAATKWLRPKKWNGNLLAGYDIGLVQLDRAVSEAIAPAARYTGSSELGESGTSVGFGRTGTGLTGATIPDYSKRAGENVIDAFYTLNLRKTPRIFLSDFDNPDNPADSAYGSDEPLDLEYLIAPGDSGGGVFVDFGSGLLLAGVHSFGASFDGLIDSDYGDISGHTRVSTFNKWIDDVLAGGGGGKGGGKGNGKGGGKNKSSEELFFDDFWVSSVPLSSLSTVPEPASMAMLVLGALALLKRRRRIA